MATALFLSGSAFLAAAGLPVFRMIAGVEGGTNLVREGDFEAGSGTALSSWSAAPQGMRWAPGAGRGGSQALAATAPDASGWRGASQTLVLDRASAAPLTVSGWSRAEDVSGGRDSGYALYVDLQYMDGTSLWGRTASFGTGTHDWERREVRILPDRPVRSLTVHCLLRGHAGRVWFDDITATEVATTGEAFMFQGAPMEMGPSATAAEVERRELATGDGLRLGLRGDRVVSVNVDGRELAGAAPGGFLARDVAANSDVFAFADGVCPELGLRLEVSMRTNATAVIVEGQICDTRGMDRAVLLVFALPVGAPGWTGDDDIRRRRPIAGRGEFVNANEVGCGTTGTMSTYPVAAIHDERTGLALGLDQGQPAQYRLGYHAATRQLFLAFDFGLVPETSRFPGAAPFRFVIYRFTPDLVERYFQRSLFQGFLPSMFSHNASENPYWRNPAWYNRDRPLFRKYVPLIRQVAEAGWQPVTGAAFDPPQVLVERFGPGPDGVTYLTLRNDSANPQDGLLTLVEPSATGLSHGAATELVSGERLARRRGGWAVGIGADATAVVRIAPGP